AGDTPDLRPDSLSRGAPAVGSRKYTQSLLVSDHVEIWPIHDLGRAAALAKVDAHDNLVSGQNAFAAITASSTAPETGLDFSGEDGLVVSADTVPWAPTESTAVPTAISEIHGILQHWKRKTDC